MSTGFLVSNQRTLNAAFANTVVTVVNERGQRKRFIVASFNEKLQPQGVMFEPRPAHPITLVNLLHVYYQVRPQCWIPLIVLVPLDVVLGRSPVDKKMLPSSNTTVDFLDVFQHMYSSMDSLRPKHMIRNLGRTVVLSSNHSPICHITTTSSDVWLPQEINLNAVQTRLPSAGRYVQFFCNDDFHHSEAYRGFLTFLDTACGSLPPKKWTVDSTGLFFFRLAPESVPPFGVQTRLLCFIACPGLYDSMTIDQSIYHHVSSSSPSSSSSSITATPKVTLDASQQTDSQTSSSDEPDDFQSYCAEHGILLPPTNPEGSKIYEFYLLGKTIATNHGSSLADASPTEHLGQFALPSCSSSSSSSSSSSLPCTNGCCSRTTITEQFETSTQTELDESLVDTKPTSPPVKEGTVREEDYKTLIANNDVAEKDDLLSNPKSFIPLSESSFWKYEDHVFFTCSTSLVPLLAPVISQQITLDSSLQSSLVLCELSTTPRLCPEKRQVHELRLGQLLAINELRLFLCREDSCDLWADKVVLSPIGFGRFRLCLFSSQQQSAESNLLRRSSSLSSSTEKPFITSMDVEVNSQLNDSTVELTETILPITTQAKRSLSSSRDGPEKVVKKQKREKKQQEQAEGNHNVEKVTDVSLKSFSEADIPTGGYEVKEEAAGDSFKEETMRLLTGSFGNPFPVILKSDQTPLSKKHRFLTENGDFVKIAGCEIDVDHHRLRKFQAIFKEEKFFIIEKDELIPIRDFVLRFCRPTIRAIVCVCYQVRHNVWIPLLPMAVSHVTRGRIKLNIDLLPRVTEPSSPLFLAMAERECNPGSDAAPIDLSNVLPSRRRRM